MIRRMCAPKRALIALAAFLVLAAPAAMAQTLIDNIEGLAFDETGDPVRFTGLMIGRDGRVEQLLARQDKRPKKPDHTIDGKGRFMMPGLIDSHLALMPLAIALLRAEGAAANGWPESAFPPPRPEDRDVAFGKLQRLLAAQGITAVADMGTTIEDWQTYRRAGDAGTLYLRIIGYGADIPAMALIAGPRPTPWLYDDRLRLAGLHLALNTPAPKGSGTPGDMAYNEAQLRNLMSRAAMSGFQPAVSAHSEAAVRLALHAIEELALTYGQQRRWRIEGFGTVVVEDATLFAAQKVTTSLVPAGPGALPAWHTLQQNGARVALGSGRGKESGTGVSGLALMAQMAELAQRADQTHFATLLAASTRHGAHAAFAETRFGQLARGQYADFVMLDGDPTSLAPAEWASLRVMETWIGGRRIYDAALEATRASAGPGQSIKGPEGEAAPVFGPQLDQLPLPAPVPDFAVPGVR